MSGKISRRKALKLVGAAGVAVAAAPYLANALAISGPVGATGQALQAAPGSGSTGSGDLLVVTVRGNEVVGYMGTSEVRVVDSSLSGQLVARFGGSA